jgi:hypothetical protein
VSVQTITRAIQFILAPVVMVTSCAILANGILSRYASINDRMRSLTKERLDLLRGSSGSMSTASVTGDPSKVERLREIDEQLPRLLHRHGLAHNSALVNYLAILIFVMSMLAIALAVLPNSAALAAIALTLFLAGTIVMLVGVLLISSEVRTSNNEIRYEVERVLSLGSDATSAPNA